MSQFSPLPNDSKLPEKQAYITKAKLIFLDTNKVHGYNAIFIWMLKLCGKSIVKELSIIFKNCKLKNMFPNLWRKSKSCSKSQKRGKRPHKKLFPSFTLTNFSIFFFEKLIFNSLFKYINENELLYPNQLGFCPFDSCVNQLLSINRYSFFKFWLWTAKKYASVLLDVSKAFDNISIRGLIPKFKSFEISGNLPELIENFQSNRFQRVVNNEKTSEWVKLMLECHRTQF